MSKQVQKSTQNTLSNDLVRVNSKKDSLFSWMEAYFGLEVTTSKSSQKEQNRDITYFINYVVNETGGDNPDQWSPRLSADYKTFLRESITETGQRRWGDRTVNRMLAHLKTFAKWIHKHRPFPLGSPMEKIKTVPTASLLSIDRAITNQERRRILDAADLLLEIGGISKDRKRFGGEDKRPKRKGYRAYRNRAIVYTLIETGMRRAAVTKLNLASVDLKNKTIIAEEKGGVAHEYNISREGLKAIEDYIQKERAADEKHYESPALFLPSSTTQNKNGRLHPNAINDIWDEICLKAGVKNKTPHSARHSMGRYIIEKTGNIAAVQRQLGHKNAAYSMQYSRITSDELKEVLNNR